MDEHQQNERTPEGVASRPYGASKKERKELRRRERIEEEQKRERRRATKRGTTMVLGAVVVVGSIAALAWYFASRPPVPEGEFLSRRGLHWHAELAVFVGGEKRDIPANVGIGVTHNPLHTHDASGVIHLEFQGAVRRDDVTLGRFFEVWGKDFMEFGSSVSMTVNGEEHAELQEYVMGDGDTIELRYDT